MFSSKNIKRGNVPQLPLSLPTVPHLLIRQVKNKYLSDFSQAKTKIKIKKIRKIEKKKGGAFSQRMSTLFPSPVVKLLAYG